MTPVETLRAAAARLRETAEKTIGGPWYTVGLPWNDRTLYVVAGDPDPHKAMFVADPEDPTMTRRGTENADATWIALAGPQIAEPLAALLEREAIWAEREGAGIVRDLDALAVARSILGGAQ